MRRRYGFNTCSSCEEQQCWNRWKAFTTQFQYMLLLRGATVCVQRRRYTEPVSIHAPLARSNFCSSASLCKLAVSIHAPLARSNDICVALASQIPQFQYMLLLRGATCVSYNSITQMRCFNTCSSCEEQRLTESTF